MYYVTTLWPIPHKKFNGIFIGGIFITRFFTKIYVSKIFLFLLLKFSILYFLKFLFCSFDFCLPWLCYFIRKVQIRPVFKKFSHLDNTIFLVLLRAFDFKHKKKIMKKMYICRLL